MEADLTVFLEFYGVPGSGKSTLSHLAAEELRKRGKAVAEPTYDSDHCLSPGMRRLRKLLGLALFGAVHPGRCGKLFRLLRGSGLSSSEVLSQSASIARKLRAYDRGRADCVIFDEGLTQSALSMTGEKGDCAANEKALYALCRNRQVRKIYVKVTPEAALARMAGRDVHDSRIERLPAAQREAALLAFQARCERLCRSGDSLVIDASLPPQRAAEEILSKLP